MLTGAFFYKGYRCSCVKNIGHRVRSPATCIGTFGLARVINFFHSSIMCSGALHKPYDKAPRTQET
jgi:hypothetical protein